ncbi:hypothetical protein LSO9J_60039 [Candidatus Liberibacter solanacearum]
MNNFYSKGKNMLSAFLYQSKEKYSSYSGKQKITFSALWE